MGVFDKPKTFIFCFHLVVIYTLRKLSVRNQEGKSCSCLNDQGRLMRSEEGLGFVHWGGRTLL
jgi:hypothetical protein